MSAGHYQRPSMLQVLLTWLLIVALPLTASPCLAATTGLTNSRPKQTTLGAKTRVWKIFSVTQESVGKNQGRTQVNTRENVVSSSTTASETPEGRFWNMDTWEGGKTDPRSLHKYTYCGGDPVSHVDPSGHLTIGETAATLSVAAAIGAWGTIVAHYAMGRLVTEADIIKGACIGAAFAAGAILSPAFGLFAVGYGILTSGSLVAEVYMNPGSSVGQKVAASGLFLAAVVGGGMAIKYAESVNWGRPTPQVTINNYIGAMAEADFAAFMRANGIEILGEQVYVRNPFYPTGRKYDFVIRDPTTGKIAAIEIKGTRGAMEAFDKKQFAADRWVNREGGEMFGSAAEKAGLSGRVIDMTYKILWEIGESE